MGRAVTSQTQSGKPVIVLKNNTRNASAIGGKTCLCAEVTSWKDGNTAVGTNECGGNQFVPINGGGKK